MGIVVGRAVVYLLLGALVVPLSVLAAMIVVYILDSRCGTPGDSGGCEMGIATVVMLSVPVGAMLGLAFGIWRGIKARNLARNLARGTAG
jgi:hypothetical protein